MQCLVKGTICEALNQVSVTFKANFYNNSTRRWDNKLLPILNLQLSGYKQANPKKDQQCCLNPSFICQCLNRVVTPLQTIITDLISFNFFFAMRSCEFSKVLGEWKTKLITLGSVRFFTKDNVTLSYSSREIFCTYSISITFII